MIKQSVVQLIRDPKHKGRYICVNCGRGNVKIVYRKKDSDKYVCEKCHFGDVENKKRGGE